MTGITSHVLDTSVGKPGEGIKVLLERNTGESGQTDWQLIGKGETDSDGRVPGLTGDSIDAGHYRINFLVEAYFESRNVDAFYPVVRIEFHVDDASQHFHVPLLLNPFGFSTYRGS